MLTNSNGLKAKLIDFGMAYQDSEVVQGTLVQAVQYRYLSPSCLLYCFHGVLYALVSYCTDWLYYLTEPSRLSSSGLQKCSSACRSATVLTCGAWAVSSCTFISKKIPSLFALNMKSWGTHLSHTSRTRPKVLCFHKFTWAVCSFTSADESVGPAARSARGPPAPWRTIHQAILCWGGGIWWSNMEAKGQIIFFSNRMNYSIWTGSHVLYVLLVASH